MRALVIALAILTAATPVDADDAAAKALFDQGKTLFAEGKYGEACAKLEASFKLSALSSTRGLLGACYEKVGKLASAWAAYRDSAALAERQGNTERAAAAREKATELEPKLAKLTIDAKAAASIKDLAVTIDGVVQPAGALNVALPIDGGPHLVSADAVGFTKWEKTVDIADGEKQQAIVPMLVADPTELETATGTTKMSRRKLIGLGILGGGGAAVGVALVFGVIAKLDWNNAECTDAGVCPNQAAKDQADSAARNANIATVVGVAGLAIASAGLIIVLTTPKAEETTPRITPVAQPGAVGFVLQGRF